MPKWLACPPARQIGVLASIFVDGVIQVLPRRNSKSTPCSRRISRSKVRVRNPENGFSRTACLWLTMPCAVMWNDLELYHDYRDFTVDPVTFPANEMRDFIRNLVSCSSTIATCEADSPHRGQTDSTVCDPVCAPEEIAHASGRYPHHSWLRGPCHERDGRGKLCLFCDRNERHSRIGSTILTLVGLNCEAHDPRHRSQVTSCLLGMYLFAIPIIRCS